MINIVKSLHLTLVAISVGLFVLRLLTVKGISAPNWSACLRYLFHGISVLLVTSALWLMQVMHLSPGQHHWLWVKIVMLMGYLTLAGVVFNRKRSTMTRRSAMVAAVLCLANAYGVANSHHPAGFFG